MLRLGERIALHSECDLMDQAAAELRRLHAECEALQADAERYRWLREDAVKDLAVAEWDYEDGYIVSNKTGEQLDEAIDAARVAIKEQG